MPIDVLSRAQAILMKFVSHISHPIDIGAKIVVSGRVKLVYQRRLPLWLADTIGRGPIEVVLSQPKCGAHSLANREDADAKFEIHDVRSEEHTSELQSLMRISYAVFCLKKKKQQSIHTHQ